MTKESQRGKELMTLDGDIVVHRGPREAMFIYFRDKVTDKCEYSCRIDVNCQTPQVIRVIWDAYRMSGWEWYHKGKEEARAEIREALGLKGEE